MSRTSRKLEHINLSLELGQDLENGFDNVNFVHQAIPETAYSDISLSTQIGELSLSSPIIINAMTGGTYETEAINKKLAIVAKELNLAMAVGSQMSAIKNKEYVSSYKIVRDINPDGIIFANLGMEATVEQAKQAIDMLNADALQLHLNVVQELIMPEGDRNFYGVIERIVEIKSNINVPIIVKEVGFGISKEVANDLHKRGINIIDIGGKGGTNFARIENKRREQSLDYFNDWGIDTASSLIETASIKGINIIASGGIINSLQIAKALGLGANAVGLAGTILKVIYDKDIEGTVKYIGEMSENLKLIMTSLGAKTVLDLRKKPMVIKGDLKDWCELRGIPIELIARR